MEHATHSLPSDVLALHLAGGTLDEGRLLDVALGPPGRWLGAGQDAWRRAGLSEPRASALARLVGSTAVEDERATCAARDYRLAWYGEPDFPETFLHLEQAPLVLCVHGRWPPPPGGLAVVGSRAATPYGLACARRLTAAAARGGRAIVSGLARGIDRAAHEAALAAGAWPVAILGNGLLCPYPPENIELQARIAATGTVFSEFPLRQSPTQWTFPRRNRLIAALARAVLVVEAGRGSGALVTARCALDLGRDVLAVPGPIDSPVSLGTNELLRDGATPVLGVEDLLYALDGTWTPDAPASDPLLAALGLSALTPDELAERLGRDVGPVRAALVTLELQHRVRRLPGGRYAQA